MKMGVEKTIADTSFSVDWMQGRVLPVRSYQMYRVMIRADNIRPYSKRKGPAQRGGPHR